jgi:hypothetical protein
MSKVKSRKSISAEHSLKLEQTLPFLTAVQFPGSQTVVTADVSVDDGVELDVGSGV